MSCNGCRVLRKGCSESCLLRPCLAAVEGSDAQGHATLFLAKFFGRAGLMGFISAVNEAQRPALFQSLLYEACGRTINPVYGSAGLLWSGQWHLCEAAVESVLKGGTPTSCFGSLSSTSAPPSAPASSTRLSPNPLGPPSPGLPPSSVMPNMNRAGGGGPTAMSAFSFPMMDASAMAYWPLAMAPMPNPVSHMAAMGGAASAAAAYQASYQQAANSHIPHLMTNNGMFGNNVPVNHISNACHMWTAEPMAVPGNSVSRPQSQHRQGFGSSPSSAGCAAVGDSMTTSLDSCMGLQGGGSPPLVAPVARRLTAHSGPFMPPVSPAPGQQAQDFAGAMLRSDLGMCIPDWAARAEPASRSLLPLLS